MHNTKVLLHLSLLASFISPSLALPSTSASISNLARRQDFPAIDPEPCTGNCTFIHDPAVIQAADGSYYRFSTNGNIAIAKADDLTGPWIYQGALLPEGSSIQVAEGQEMWVCTASSLLRSSPSNHVNHDRSTDCSNLHIQQ